ncbi:hypothetical protein [Natronorubrum daqingense]|uniref:Uncharacterized protein n=1 Tax=Natronorubrum daqingense TaxID=588898 RepID=A0A1N7G1Y7_9EURY|nr:hypothetical protein [Natronorubrum daqingense]APX98643.1 hypothetical protein BB347_18300 [Natronorubrum daqingense]SIS06578.1 hypothetical protein SAMN05421809_3677 [Natronorubrum daqingense]
MSRNERYTTTVDGSEQFESVDQDQIEVHWQHPRTELELPLLLVWPSPVVDEWAAVVENGVATVVCHEWLVEIEIGGDTNVDGDRETEIQKRAEEWGEDEAIPGYVAEALLEYDSEYGPVHTVANPYTLESDDSEPESSRDEGDEQTALTDGGQTVDDSNSSYETAEAFVDGTDLIPHPMTGAVPIYEGHPPDTHLPAWRCHDCGKSSPTILEFWRADRNRDRLARERSEYEYGTDEWDAFTEGLHHYRDQLDRLYSALPANISSWVSSEVLSRSGRFFEPYAGENAPDMDGDRGV